MFGNATPYLVALVMIGFCALSAFVLITVVNHFDGGHEQGPPGQH